MESDGKNLPWLKFLQEGEPACCFYTTEEEFFSISLPFFQESLFEKNRRSLWILPPPWSFSDALKATELRFGTSLKALIKKRQLLMIGWDQWYGTEAPLNGLLKKTASHLDEALQDGYEGLSLFSHSPARSSNYWKDFYLFEEAISRKFSKKQLLSVCAYSVIDCPTSAIPTIARNYSLCLIHRGTEWEWLSHPPTAKQLPNKPISYRQTADVSGHSSSLRR